MFGSYNFNKGRKFKVFALPNRQHLCLHILSENEWYTQNGNVESSKGDWDFFTEQGYEDHSRASFKNIECELNGRLGVCEENGHSEWMLNPKDFQKIYQKKASPQIDLLISRLFHQLKNYVLSKQDPCSLGTDSFQLNWSGEILYGFRPFCLLHKSQRRYSQIKWKPWY